MSERKKGYNARLSGKSKEDNPHPPGTRDYYEWERGWEEADLELQKKEIEEPGPEFNM